MVIMIVYSLVNDSSYKQLDYVTIIGILETKGGSFFLYRRTIDIIFLKISWWSNIIRWQEGHVSCSIYIRYITVFKMNCHTSLFIKTTAMQTVNWEHSFDVRHQNVFHNFNFSFHKCSWHCIYMLFLSFIWKSLQCYLPSFKLFVIAVLQKSS